MPRPNSAPAPISSPAASTPTSASDHPSRRPLLRLSQSAGARSSIATSTPMKARNTTSIAYHSSTRMITTDNATPTYTRARCAVSVFSGSFIAPMDLVGFGEFMSRAIRFDPTLPVSARRADIRAAIEAHPVVVVCGETGSGKTTQLPKILLEMGRGRGRLIGHTQPRRIAARSVAARIAEELGGELGETVGYKVRFQEQLRRGAAIKLMTDGILLAETQGDPLLQQYDALILDEAHERSLNIDFLLGYVKTLA